MILIFSGSFQHFQLEVKGLRYTRFEKARIIGARALQISMGAPILIKIPKGMIDPVQIAMLEFKEGAIPITVVRKSDIKPMIDWE